MRKLQACYEQYEKGDDDWVSVLVWTEDSRIFRAKVPNIDFLSTNDALQNAVGEEIPANHLFPPWNDSLTEFRLEEPMSPHIYVKNHYHHLGSYDGTPCLSELFVSEVKALEAISKKPHPNVNKYLGCIRNGDAIGGICLEKHFCSVADVVRGTILAERAPPFEPDVIIPGIKAGIDHIHSFGLVHDDINPTNIMLDEAGNPVIIDFDSCVVVGAASRGGTPGWSQKPTIAAFENDMYGLDLVAKYIRGEYDGEDYSFHFKGGPAK